VTRRALAIALMLALGAHVRVLGQPSSRLDRLDWLQGCWELVTPTQTIQENWIGPRAGSMLGMSRTMRDGKLVAYESIIIREHDGRLAYEAHPSGQPTATFMSTTLGAATVVFENPQHDFPQKIGYRRDGDALLAWTEGPVNGTTRRTEFPYHRVECGGPPVPGGGRP
jgi:uncharacterized protein DUF6265